MFWILIFKFALKLGIFPLLTIFVYCATQVGIYVAFVRSRHIICAILARTLCVRDAQKMLILFVSERIKVCAEYA